MCVCVSSNIPIVAICCRLVMCLVLSPGSHMLQPVNTGVHFLYVFRKQGVLSSFCPALPPVSRDGPPAECSTYYRTLFPRHSGEVVKVTSAAAPPLLRPSDACPILTSFALPTRHWFSTRPGKSNYTGVREVDFPIMDSMLRMRADDNTHVTPLLPPLSLSPRFFNFVSNSMSPPLSISLCVPKSSSPSDFLSSFFSLDPLCDHIPLF